MKIALICGVTGQDGSYLADFLIKKNYLVLGTTRDAQHNNFHNLKRLGIFDKITYLTMKPDNLQNVLETIKKYNPDEVYFLSGQSSVGLSFEIPAETIQSITLSILNILETCRILGGNFKFYNSGSSECFGDTGAEPATEKTQFKPCSPYAIAKTAAFWLVDTYRKSYGLHASTGILFNHESIFRSQQFVTKKIISSAIRIASGSKEILELGRIEISRDWGWAPEYVEAMWLMLQQEKPSDFFIATVQSNTLKDFIAEAFSAVGLEWEKYVRIKQDLYRPSDIKISRADPNRALRKLNWKANSRMKEVVSKLIKNKL